MRPKPDETRGALSNRTGRFESLALERVDDGWGIADEALPPVQTTVQPEPPASVITRNDSPDIPFDLSINPYRGCEHGCSYCLDGETRILMGDGSEKPLAELKVGDEIYGTARRGFLRRYVRTRVLAHWRTNKPAMRVRLADGTELIASGDHRFLTERGWKFVAQRERPGQRPYLTPNDRLMGFGRIPDSLRGERTADYRRGYHCGPIRGDGHPGDCRYARPGRFEWPELPAEEWMLGFVGGIFDGEGSFNYGASKFGTVVETQRIDALKPIRYVGVRGGLRELLRFMGSFDPSIVRKRDIAGQSVKSAARLGIVSIEPLAGSRELFDITTGTGDFLANGVISHNCYARPSHQYVNLSAGLDFETRLFYKKDAAARLREELGRRSYKCSAINLGANTDPYQPLERRLGVTRSILEVLAEAHHPVTIVTKGALVVRDIDVLSRLAAERLVKVFVSVTTLDDELKRRMEPRAASPRARLAAIGRLAAAGVPVGVMYAPVVPAINDHELEAVLEASAAAGSTTAGYVLLRLPGEVRELFFEWLDLHFPDRAQKVRHRIRELRGGRDNDSRFGHRMRGQGPWAELLRRRFDASCRKNGLGSHRADPLTTALFRPPNRSPGQMELW